MTDLGALIKEGLAAFDQRVHAITDDQWDKPTPCSDWTVGQLVDHLIDEQQWVPPLLAGHDLETAGKIVKGTHDTGDRVRAWEEGVLNSQRAWLEEGAVDRTVNLSRGETPASQYMSEMITDSCIHSWDLGAAIGDKPTFSAELIEFVATGLESMGTPSDVAPGFFAPPVQVADDASPMDRLLALSGRDPNWTPPA